MLQREIQTFPTFIYPHDPFRLVEMRFNPGRMAQMETLLALANGKDIEADPRLQTGTVRPVGLRDRSERYRDRRMARRGRLHVCALRRKCGIHLQDDEFLSKKPWDFANTPPDKYPLLLHFQPLVIYRHNVIKQADVVLAMFLLGKEFSLEQKRRNFDYYDPLTTGDSSLSVSIQSILAMELGHREKAVEYLRYSLWMDLADVHSNVEQGCHIASMGGAWMAAVYGFAGMREQNGRITFHPRLGQRIEGLRFHLTIQGQHLTVEVEGRKGQTTYLLREGSGLTIGHMEEELQLEPGKPVSRGFKFNDIS